MSDNRPAALWSPVDAFPEDDPLTYEELPHDQIALRALMAVLAETGASVSFPAHLMPSHLALVIPSGWKIECTTHLTEDFTDFARRGEKRVALSARWVDRTALIRPEVSGG